MVTQFSPSPSIADPSRSAIDDVLPLDLSSCSNLRILRVDPDVANHPQFDALLQTISSKHFEKLVINGRKTSPHWATNDQVLYSFAKRLRELGATKPLTMVLEYWDGDEDGDGTPDVQSIWPLFCQVGVIVEEDCNTRDPYQR